MFVRPWGGLAERNPPFFGHKMAGYAEAVIAETPERELPSKRAAPDGSAPSKRREPHCVLWRSCAARRMLQWSAGVLLLLPPHDERP
jgi:hypothetical protein